MLILLAYISMGSILIPLSLWLRWTKEHKTNPFLKVILLFLITSLVFDLLVYGFGKMGKSSTLIVNLFFIIQFYLLSYLYLTYLGKKKLISFVIIIFSLFMIINTLFFQPFDQIQSWSHGLQSVCLIILTVAAHLHLFNYPSENERVDYMIFWVNMAFMFYFSLNLYVFISSGYIIMNESEEIGLIFWSFHNGFNIIKNVMIAVGIYYMHAKALKF